MDRILCIYHGNCADGFGAAWAVRHALGDQRVEFYAGIYQDAPPDVTGRHVLVVDFSYKRPVLLEMAARARSVIVLDHHKSAAEDLAGFRQVAPYAQWRDDGLDRVEGAGPGIAVLFDMERSGAGIAWDFFNDPNMRPRLIDHIEDRDLWRFALPGTREIQAALFSYPYYFRTWDRLMNMDTEELRREGVAIERKHHKDVAELVEVTRRKMIIGGHLVPVANLPYTLTSDAGNLMCGGVDEGLAGSWIPPFAACYWDTPAGRVFSLRSIEGGADVSEIAKQYGGGGHKHAAGFRVAHADLAQFEA